MAIGALAVRVGADVEPFNRGMKSTQGPTKQFQKSMATSAKRVAAFTAAATAAGAALTTALVKSGLESVDAQAKLARGLGATTEGLGALQRSAGRAGVSSSELETATTRLNQRLGEAVTQGGIAADTLDKLGLEAGALSAMDVDERMAAISDAMRDAGMSSQEMAFALRNLGIRQASIVNLMQEGGDVIRESRDRIEAYGLALNDIDAAKVEAANDAMDEGSIVMRGLTQQMAIQFAPVLQGVAELMSDAAAETGGLGTVAERTFEVVMKGAAFSADAMRGVHVVVKGIEAAFWGLSTVGTTVFRTLSEGWDSVANSIGEGINLLIRGMNSLPGINVEELELGASRVTQLFTDMNDAAHANMKESAAELHDLLMQPLPSEGIEAWLEKVKVAAEEAAQATVAARDTSGLSINDLPEDEASTVDEEAEQEALNRRLEMLERHLMNREELEIAAHRDRIAQLEVLRDEEGNLAAEHQDLLERLNADHQKRMTDMEQEAADARARIRQQERERNLQGWSSMFGNLSSLMQTESKELFRIGQLAAGSQAVLDGYSAATSAFKWGMAAGGPVLAWSAATASSIATGVQLNKIKNASFGGGSGGNQAPPSGGSSVPNVPQQQQQQPQHSRALMVQGDFDKSSLYTGEAVRGIMDAIAEAQRDGYTVVI